MTLVALVRRFGGGRCWPRPPRSPRRHHRLYDLLWRGPILPFAAGVALTPVAAVLVRDLLDDRRLRLGAAVALVAGVAEYMCLHPSILFGAIVFVLPMLVQRWWGAGRRALREFGLLVGAGALAAAVCAIEVAGALHGGQHREARPACRIRDRPGRRRAAHLRAR